MLVTRVSVHVDHTWSKGALRQVCLRDEGAVQVLLLGILDREMVLGALQATERAR